jgi:hypothetical protein
VVTWDEVVNSQFQFCDYLDELDYDSPAPVKADEDGFFPAPAAGRVDRTVGPGVLAHARQLSHRPASEPVRHLQCELVHPARGDHHRAHPREAGYYCGHFGKWHVGPVKAASPTSPGAMGFHEWVSHDNFFEMDPSLSRNGGPPEVFEGEGSEVIIERDAAFIDRARRQGKPFFAVVWFGSPHEPYSGLPEDLALYDDLPAKYTDRTVRLTSNETGLPVERPLGDVLRERYAEITAMDRAIGTLRDYLAREGLRKTRWSSIAATTAPARRDCGTRHCAAGRGRSTRAESACRA